MSAQWVRITMVNALGEPTSAHWHGIERESYYGGVAGFSGAGRRIALLPLLATLPLRVVRGERTQGRASSFVDTLTSR